MTVCNNYLILWMINKKYSFSVYCILNVILLCIFFSYTYCLQNKIWLDKGQLLSAYFMLFLKFEIPSTDLYMDLSKYRVIFS